MADDYRLSLEDGVFAINELEGERVGLGLQGKSDSQSTKRFQRVEMSREEFERAIGLVRIIKEWKQ